MSKIIKLDESIIRQVAAGEVVQRPASILKECLENSLDAGANAIEIDIEEGGVSLLRIKDNGEGITANELPLALQRHATSKIKSIDDLNSIHSYGFRGEALASISAVSRFEIESKHKDAEIGAKIELFESDSTPDVYDCTCGYGTTITVKDLFYNVPARRRFLKSTRTEFSYLDEVIKKIALANFNVSFTVTNNGKRVRDFLAVEKGNEQERIEQVLGTEFSQNNMLVDNSENDYKISGWISKPYFSRGYSDMQYLFVNNRVVKDKAIAHAVKRAYSDVMQSGRFPAFVLFITIDPTVVDVNVHPSKEEIRFTDSKSISQFVYKSLKKITSQPLAASFIENTEFNINSILESNEFKPSKSEEKHDFSSSVILNDLTNEQQNAIASSIIIDNKTSVRQPLQSEQKIINNNDQQKSITGIQHHPLGHAIGQLSGLFILAQNKSGLIIVDMHAAHERVIYEKMKTAYKNNGISSQLLLVPVKIKVECNILKRVKEIEEVYFQLGFSLSYSGDAVIIKSVPALLKKADVAALFSDVNIEISRYDTSDSLTIATNNIIATMACHAAVRANDYLSLDQMNGLLREMEQTNAAEQCNHGRPTCKQLSLKELDSFFRRGT